MRAIERIVAGGGENLTHAINAVESCGVYGFELLTACENRPAEDAAHQMANADQRSSQKDWLFLVFTP